MRLHNGQSQRKRVVVTGLGLVSALGNTLPASWERLTQAKCAISPITKFDAIGYPCQLAAEVQDFEPRDYMNKKDARRLAPFLHYAMAAATEAIDQANLDFDQEDPTRIGIEVGSGMGGVDVIEAQRVLLEKAGPRKVSPTTIPALLANMASSYLSIHFGILGPVHAPVSACATGITSIGEGMRRIVWGDADVMLVGGTESTISPMVIAAFGRMRALSTRNEPPYAAITPFDKARDGTVIGEGAGVLVLESLAHAQARQANILAEVKGYGFSSDAYHISSPRDDGQGAKRAIQNALRDGGLAPTEIDYISAHGTGTQMNDAFETKAIKLALGEKAYQIPISAVKSMTGHTLGAAGAIAAVTAIQSLQTATVLPTVNLRQPDPVCDLDYVPNEARQQNVTTVLVNGFGFGGQNASLVLQKWAGH